jgi:hypothetical protein
MSKPPAPAAPIAKPRKGAKSESDDFPPPEEDLGGGDFVSPEVSPPTEDDKPLE